MSKFDFEKLEVYQKSLDLMSEIYDLFEKLPSRIQISIGSNLLRAATSIASNIAEGSGRRNKKEKRQFFSIAQASTYECIPSLEILGRKGYLTGEDSKKFYNDGQNIAKMLTGLISYFSS